MPPGPKVFPKVSGNWLATRLSLGSPPPYTTENSQPPAPVTVNVTGWPVVAGDGLAPRPVSVPAAWALAGSRSRATSAAGAPTRGVRMGAPFVRLGLRGRGRGRGSPRRRGGRPP